MAKSFHSFDGMCWPLPGERCDDIEWKLRYASDSMTREDQLLAASILSAYRQMIFDPHHKRVRVIRELRTAVGKTDDRNET